MIVSFANIYIMFGFNRDKFKAIRLMTLQMPIIQGALLALLNVFNAIDTVSNNITLSQHKQ